MKSSRFLLLVVAVIAAVDCFAAEMRTIGDVQVDLQPLIDWSAKKKGDRPLKHWKLLQVLESKKPSTSPVVLCDIEGLQTEIILRNCPTELLELLRQKSELESKLAAARKDEATAAENLNDSHNKRQARQAKRANTAARNIQKAVSKDLSTVNQKIKQQKLYAMATGTTFDGLPVWDTGLRGR